MAKKVIGNYTKKLASFYGAWIVYHMAYHQHLSCLGMHEGVLQPAFPRWAAIAGHLYVSLTQA